MESRGFDVSPRVRTYWNSTFVLVLFVMIGLVVFVSSANLHGDIRYLICWVSGFCFGSALLSFIALIVGLFQGEEAGSLRTQFEKFLYKPELLPDQRVFDLMGVLQLFGSCGFFSVFRLGYSNGFVVFYLVLSLVGNQVRSMRKVRFERDQIARNFDIPKPGRDDGI